MQIRVQKLVKLSFLALVFGLLVGCGSSDSSSKSNVGGNVTDGNGTTCTQGFVWSGTACVEQNRSVPASEVPVVLINARAGGDVFPAAPSHIFGPLWDSASVETYTVKYSDLGYYDQLAYKDQVEDRFPDLLQIGNHGVYHNILYYRSFVGDASVKVTNDGAGVYSVVQAVDIVLPLPGLQIDAGVFADGAAFPQLSGFPITEVSTTIHYGYFGTPNFQTYKATTLRAAGFLPKGNTDIGNNIWTKTVNGLTYTFEHDNPLLDATKIPILGGLVLGGVSIGGFTNHWIANWTNLDKWAKWTISVQ
ncbi:MAG: hypothetical protein LBI78_00875 [Campylobacteraceae bacterium]|jgi:hypothetical protein|nr:hypothetical protein [Campylobacteraceae bacterium]